MNVNLPAMLPQVVRIMELGPSAIEGSRLKLLIERGKKAANGSQASPAALPEAKETKAPQYTPGTAFVGLYEVAKYVATALPTMTVAQAIEALEAVGIALPASLQESVKGYMNQQLNTLLLFGLPLKQRDIQAFLARLPELDPSFVPASGDTTAISNGSEEPSGASVQDTGVLKG